MYILHFFNHALATMDFHVFTINNYKDYSCVYLRTHNNDQQLPVHVCCVIHTSFTCAHKMRLLQQSLNFVLNKLGPKDRLSIVSCTNQAPPIVHQSITSMEEKETIRSKVNQLSMQPNGNVLYGMMAAQNCMIKDNFPGKQVVIVFTEDACNNFDGTTPVSQNMMKSVSNLTMYSIGLGEKYNASLQMISKVGNGSYYVIHNTEQIIDWLGNVFGETIGYSFHNVRVLLPANTSVCSEYPVQNTEHHTIITIGNLTEATNVNFIAAIPLGIPVIMQGYDTIHSSTIELTTHVCLKNRESQQNHATIQYHRHQAIALSKQVDSLLHSFSTEEEITELESAIQLEIEQVENDKQSSNHYQWTSILNKLKLYKHMLDYCKKEPGSVIPPGQ